MVLLPSPQAIFPSVSLPLSPEVFFFSRVCSEYIPYCNFSPSVKGLSLLAWRSAPLLPPCSSLFPYLKALYLLFFIFPNSPINILIVIVFWTGNQAWAPLHSSADTQCHSGNTIPQAKHDSGEKLLGKKNPKPLKFKLYHGVAKQNNCFAYFAGCFPVSTPFVWHFPFYNSVTVVTRA